MKKVRSLILAGLLAMAPATVMSPMALAQENVAAAAPAADNAAISTESPDNATAPAAEAAPAAKVAAPPRMKPTEGIGMPKPGEITLQEQFTSTGHTARWLHDKMLLPLITIISVFVLLLMLYVMVRYRRSANPVPSKTSHNTVIEVVWTLVPVLILLVIAIPSIGLLADQYKPAPKDALTVKVTVDVCAVDAVTGLGVAEIVTVGAVASRVRVASALAGAVSVLFEESVATV